jgi:signal transduction histidine kinase
MRWGMGGIEVLGRRLPEDDDDREFATMASAAANELNDMVTSLLDINRMESGKMPVNKCPSDIRSVVASAVKTVTANVRFKAITLTETGEAVTASVDENLIRRVLQNLISNAIKFSSSGSTISLVTIKDDANAKVAITDTVFRKDALGNEGLLEQFWRRIPLARLQRSQRAWRLVMSFLPPLERGRIWST